MFRQVRRLACWKFKRSVTSCYHGSKISGSQTIESLSNDAGDGNENGKKAIGFKPISWGRGFDVWGRAFDFDRQKPGINSEAVTKSVPRGFLKVTLLEKGMKLIMSILRKVLSSSSHLIVKLDWNRIPPWKSEDFLRVTDQTCSDMSSRCSGADPVVFSKRGL